MDATTADAPEPAPAEAPMKTEPAAPEPAPAKAPMKTEPAAPEPAPAEAPMKPEPAPAEAPMKPEPAAPEPAAPKPFSNSENLQILRRTPAQHPRGRPAHHPAREAPGRATCPASEPCQVHAKKLTSRTEVPKRNPQYVGKKQTCPVTNSTPTWRLRYLARQARS